MPGSNPDDKGDPTVTNRISICMAACLLAATALPSLAHAAGDGAVNEWYGGEYKSCDGSTIDIVECVMAIQKKWDKRLNTAYGKTLAGLSAERKTALRGVQRKWIAYRDANCSFYDGGEGTIARIEAATCLMALTRQRAQELEMGLEP